jgi:hypothetical protein
MQKLFCSCIVALMLVGCDDGSIVTVYDKSIKTTPIECLRVSIMPQDKQIEQSIKSLYSFKDVCNYSLNISYKSSIVCNSPYNAAQKNLSAFPNSYLNMEIRKGMSLEYSYYIDLQHKPNSQDIQKGWQQITKDLDIKLDIKGE